jgi:hypothetical protein
VSHVSPVSHTQAIVFIGRDAIDHSPFICPLLVDFLEEDIRATELAEILWSVSKLGFKLKIKVEYTIIFSLFHHHRIGTTVGTQ